MPEPSILLRKVGKRYRIGGSHAPYRTFRESLAEAIASPVRLLRKKRSPPVAEIWALRDVDLEVRPGEVLGVLGRNGAGKSTLLKVLARITRPTEGFAELRGRVGSLLDVGTGFHSELTGRENIQLNGAILGMSSSEVRRSMRRIIEFAGVDDFLDTPLKHYSSGMRVRLAFAITAQLETEILLADEVLAVGDAAFQSKCIDAMGSMARSGRTVFFVSHNMGAVGELCTRAILLDKGRIVASGRTQEIIRRYLSEFSPTAAEVTVAPPKTESGVTISRVSIADTASNLTTQFEWHAGFAIAIEFVVAQSLPAVSIGVSIVNQLGVRLVHSWAVFQERFEPGTYVARASFPPERLSPGRYHLDLVAERYGVEYYHKAEQVVAFDIVKNTGDFGYDLEDYASTYARLDWQLEARTKE